jgi:hypothetical protein
MQLGRSVLLLTLFICRRVSTWQLRAAADVVRVADVGSTRNCTGLGMDGTSSTYQSSEAQLLEHAAEVGPGHTSFAAVIWLSSCADCSNKWILCAASSFGEGCFGTSAAPCALSGIAMQPQTS